MPGVRFTALCGATVSPQTADFVELGGAGSTPPPATATTRESTVRACALRWEEQAT
jgi:hypothetical protein